MSVVNTSDLTGATIEGTGVFDVLMRANKVHLEAEFNKGRIKGPEYATVYLGSLDTVMNTSLQFLLQKQKVDAELRLIESQILQANAQTAQIQAQTAQIALQSLLIQAQTLQVEAQTALTTQQTANAVIEGTVLTATKCKLEAEFDVLILTKAKVTNETELISWKTVTEKAQTLALGVDENSVVGKQKALYGAQTAGFSRDAEQKAAKTLIDTWNVRRTTDEATVADGVNMLNDATVGRAVTKLLAGINA